MIVSAQAACPPIAAQAAPTRQSAAKRMPDEVARITKTWAGLAKEMFTKGDKYVVQIHRPLEEPLRSLVISAAVAVDTVLKQGGDRRNRH